MIEFFYYNNGLFYYVWFTAFNVLAMNLTDKNFCYSYSLLQVTYSRIQMIVLFSKCGLFKKLLIETTLKEQMFFLIICSMFSNHLVY